MTKYKIGDEVIVKSVATLEATNDCSTQDLKAAGRDWREACERIYYITRIVLQKMKYDII